jgi:hypothetical protein
MEWRTEATRQRGAVPSLPFPSSLFKAHSSPAAILSLATYLIAAPPPQKHGAGPQKRAGFFFARIADRRISPRHRAKRHEAGPDAASHHCPKSDEAGPGGAGFNLSSQPPGGLPNLRRMGPGCCLDAKCNEWATAVLRSRGSSARDQAPAERRGRIRTASIRFWRTDSTLIE